MCFSTGWVCRFSDFWVDIVENLFTDFSERVRFLWDLWGGILGSWTVVDQVIFVVFQGNKSLLFCDLFCKAVDVELLGDRFCLWVNDVGGVGAGFLVGGSDAVPQEFVVLRLVKLIKVWSFLGRNEGFCRFLDFADVFVRVCPGICCRRF